MTWEIARVSRADVIASNRDAMERLQAAGIHTPLVIDASNRGKDLAMLDNTAATLEKCKP
jgi:hypothetical protein